MIIKKIAFGLILTLLVASCKPQQDTLTYFRDIDTETFSAIVDPVMFEPKIEPADELSIAVTSIRPELAMQYNLPLINPAQVTDGMVRAAQAGQATYIVSADGDITMPILGKIHVVGLTVDQLAAKIEEMVGKEVKNPTVTVKLMNFKINVAGEVTEPGTFSVNGNRVSILDALAMAGDLTPYGLRENILLIREENGKRKAYKIDLSDPATLSSPTFYLKQNDYIYVAPNEVRNDNAKYNQNNAYKLTVISTVVSAASVVASLVIALSIK